MSERDTDIEFDFFEDLEPPQPVQEEERPRLRRPGPPGPRRPGHGPASFTPLLRLAGLILFAILVIVLLVFWVQSCNGASKRNSYKHYMEKVASVATQSEKDGRTLNDALTTPGIKASELADRLDQIANREDMLATAASDLSPPGPLRAEQLHMVEAIGFRIIGLRGLAETLRRTAGSKDTAGGGVDLAAQAQRLVTSDVVWDDLFRDASVQELKNQGITGVRPPDSTFVSNPDFATARFWAATLDRFRGVTNGGVTPGLHGTGLGPVKALSGTKSQTLDPNVENTVTAGTDLAFSVTVEDTGDHQEVRIKVILTIEQSPKPITKQAIIDSINAGEQKTVLFHNLGQVQFATKTTVKVDIAPVPGEKNTSNNSATFPVIFSLPS